MKKNSLNDHADDVLEWLNNVSDDELFNELSECGSSIQYAINYESSPANLIAFWYQSDKQCYDIDYLMRMIREFNNLRAVVNSANDEAYSLAA